MAMALAERYVTNMHGVLSCFDRIIITGTLPGACYAAGMTSYLYTHGILAYFIEFLNLTGLWSRWEASCPLAYTSPNAPTKAEVLGTWMLSMLAGQRRYAHVTAIRCDGINPGLLGMRKVISEDALRNALKRIPEAEGTTWLDTHLADSVAPLLDAPWILDTDTTIKPLYRHQEGAPIG